MLNMDLVTPYREFFQLVLADTEELRREVFRIRYDVYCTELGWEDGSRIQDEQEKDEYDEFSRFCLLLHRPTNMFAGCVRLVMARADTGLPAIPLHQHCRDTLNPEILDIDSLPRETFGEISRLAIRQQFRRRPGEKDTPDGMGEQLFQMQKSQRRRFPHIALGLYLGAASIGIGAGLNGVFAMMEPRLARHMRITGINFLQVGDVMEYHGPRAPFYISREQLFNQLRPELLKLLEAVHEDLGIVTADNT